MAAGRVYLCGNGNNGVLGDGNITSHNASTPYMLPLQERVIDIAAGDFHTILQMGMQLVHLIFQEQGDIRTFGNPTLGVLCSLTSLSIPTVVIPSFSIGGISRIAGIYVYILC